MTTASAPGKVYLFGEHAVVYGEPAVPCAIERRAVVTVDRRDDGRVRVDAPILSFEGVSVEFGEGPPRVDVPTDLARQGVRYIDAAVDQARAAADDPDAGYSVSVQSDLPIGAGLGSSAAVSVATIDAAARESGTTLEREEIARRAYRVEHEVQSGQASRADTFCSTMGGAVRVEGDDCQRLGTPELPFVIGYDGGSGDTGELVTAVRTLKEDYGFAADTIATIGELVRRGEQLLDDGNLRELGRLMDMNHGLLSALGVSSRTLDAMVWAAREAGADGVKLTGAGGGGCVVALDETGATKTALEYAPECEQAFRADLAEDGLRRK